MNRRVLAGFHLTMGVIYLAIFVADATHLDAFRDVLLLSSLGFCLTGTLLYLGLRLALLEIAAKLPGRARRSPPVTRPSVMCEPPLGMRPPHQLAGRSAARPASSTLEARRGNDPLTHPPRPEPEEERCCLVETRALP